MLFDIVRSEWTKVRTVRSTIWSIAIISVINLGIGTVSTLIANAHWTTLDSKNRNELIHDPVGWILQPSGLFTQIVISLLAAMIITSEYSSGTIRASVLAVPKRLPMLFVKLGILLVMIYCLSEVLAFGSFFIGQAILGGQVSISLHNPGVVRALLMYGVYLDIVALFAFGVGTILRSTAITITIAIVTIVVLPLVVLLVPGKFGEQIAALVPASNAASMAMSTGSMADYPFSWQVSLGAFAAWAIVAVMVGALTLRRRDV